LSVRVVERPKHGSIDSEVGHGFTGYSSDNPRSKCNAQESEVTRIWYKSEAGFKGHDQAQIEVIFPTGSEREATFVIEVK
jgi:hypothetical protein